MSHPWPPDQKQKCGTSIHSLAASTVHIPHQERSIPCKRITTLSGFPNLPAPEAIGIGDSALADPFGRTALGRATPLTVRDRPLLPSPYTYLLLRALYLGGIPVNCLCFAHNHRAMDILSGKHARHTRVHQACERCRRKRVSSLHMPFALRRAVSNCHFRINATHDVLSVPLARPPPSHVHTAAQTRNEACPLDMWRPWRRSSHLQYASSKTSKKRCSPC
jgi:hypothetical protein